MHKYLLILAVCAAMIATQSAAPASSTAGSIMLKPNRCLNKDGTTGPCTRPDLTAGPSITVAGHVTPWGGNVTLTDADAIPQFKPHCAFNIAYILKNVGLGNAGPPATATFQDLLYMNNDDMAWTVGRQTGLTLPPSTYWVQHQPVYLLLGDNRLYLRIDNGNHVGESNENNNLFYVRYHLTGNCQNPIPFHALLP